MNPWIIDSVITVTKEAAKRNGFRLEPAGDNRIALMTNKHPYAKDICIVRFESWEQAQIWFAGYEQQIMEAFAEAGLSKSNKSKEKNT